MAGILHIPVHTSTIGSGRLRPGRWSRGHRQARGDQRIGGSLLPPGCRVQRGPSNFMLRIGCTTVSSSQRSAIWLVIHSVCVCDSSRPSCGRRGQVDIDSRRGICLLPSDRCRRSLDCQEKQKGKKDEQHLGWCAQSRHLQTPKHAASALITGSIQ